MYSAKVLTSPVKEMCLKVQVVDLLLRGRLGPDVEVNLASCYTNTHLSIIHTHAHSALCPMLGPVDGFGPKSFRVKLSLDPI